jgi:hypothetical protein
LNRALIFSMKNARGDQDARAQAAASETNAFERNKFLSKGGRESGYNRFVPRTHKAELRRGDQ